MRKVILLISITIIAGCSGTAVFLPDLREFVPAKYKLPEDKKLAILIDDFCAPLPIANLKTKLAEKINNVLVDEGPYCQENIINYDEVKRVLIHTNNPMKMQPVAQIGRKVNADFVIYINIVEHSLQQERENPLVRPYIKAYVKVIKVETKEDESTRVWPIEKIGKEIVIQERTSAETIQDVDKEKHYTELIDKLGDKVAKLFFDHREGKIR